VRRLLCALVALLALASAWPAAADPPLWRIRRGEAEVVLFGSVHVLPADLAWRFPALESALAEADAVWFEIPDTPDSRAEGATTALRRGSLPRGRRLTDLLSAEGRELLARAAARLGIPMAQLQGMRPWFAEAYISLADLQRGGARQIDGVEQQLSDRLPPGTPRRAFETAAQQIKMLASQPEREQAVSLVEALRELETDPDAFKNLQAAWIAGDVGRIEREALVPMRRQTPRLFKVLVLDRNRRWAREIERMLSGRQTTLVVVGVGHLVGAGSVPALLRSRGYDVEGP
jgi:uncharacterized protein YbaP (TraB family)